MSKTPIRLSGPVIVEAALEIIDGKGLPALSMRGLGNRLHVEGMALYRYFPEKGAILDQVVATVLEGVKLPSDKAGWRDKLRAAAISLRERLLLHPNAMPLVASRWSSISVLRSLERSAIGELLAGGFDEQTAKTIMKALMSHVLGHSWIDFGGYVGELPDSGGLVRSPVLPTTPDLDDPVMVARRLDFERGLELLLDGAAASLV